MIRRTHITTLFPYTTLFRSENAGVGVAAHQVILAVVGRADEVAAKRLLRDEIFRPLVAADTEVAENLLDVNTVGGDRKSTRLNSSHITISYAVFCLKKKKFT